MTNKRDDNIPDSDDHVHRTMKNTQSNTKPINTAAQAAAPPTPASPTWVPQPTAATLLARLINGHLHSNTQLAAIQHQLLSTLGQRLIDRLDTIEIPYASLEADLLRGAGYIHTPLPEQEGCWRHPGGRLPTIIRGRGHNLFLRVDNIATACAAHDVYPTIDGTLGTGIRQACLAEHQDISIWAIERCGSNHYRPAINDEQHQLAVQSWHERLTLRPRGFDKTEMLFAATQQRLHKAVAELGAATACDLFFNTERQRYIRRNPLAAFYHSHAEQLGFGWGAVDHYTYRCSRRHFCDVIHSLEMLGMQRRERFHAGAEAGWGAQVMEHPITGTVVFADVDLDPDELATDLGHDPLPERDYLGTVGLWCHLHGEAFLQAGLHHIAVLGDFTTLCQVIATWGASTMAPFTNFPHLHQCFSTGTMWPVDAARIQSAFELGALNIEQADRIRTLGSIGSHLEIIERNDGFKGFNQQGVSHIISATDPRHTKS